MSDSDVIKEFLVSLGFTVDETKLKKFSGGIAGATKMATGLALAAATMAVAAVSAVNKMAEKFEALYYLSQRVGSSASNISALSYAFEQMGGKGDQAKQALGALADFMQLLPGGESVIQGMGVATRKANGEMRDTTEILFDLAKRWKGMDLSQANVEAQMLGIDTATLRVLRRDLDGWFQDYHDKLARSGLDMEAAAAASARLQQRWESLLASLAIFVDGLLVHLIPALEKTYTAVENLWNKFLEWKNGATSIVSSQWGPELKGATKSVSGLQAALGELWSVLSEKLKPVLEWLAPFVDRFVSGQLKALSDRLDGITKIVQALTHLLKGEWKEAWQAAGDAMRLFGKAKVEAIFGGDNDHEAQAPAGARATPSGAPPAAAGSGRQPIGIRNNNPGNLRRWGSRPTNGGFATFDTPLAGLTAMAKQLVIYGERGWNSVEKIISKWAPSNENDTQAYIAAVAKKLGVDPKVALDLTDPATLQALMGAIVTQENGKNPYASALYNSAAAAALRRPVEVSQKTEIRVIGADDPRATGRAVASEQDRVNGDMIRSFRTAAA